MTTVSRDAFVNWELAQDGKPYKNDEHRCDPNSPTHDCSGLDCASMRANGQPTYPCLDTFQITAQIRNASKGVSVAVARATKGYVLLEGGPDRSKSPGGHGHIATSLGDGRTIEAYDTAHGVIIGHVDGRPWADAGPFPGVDYSQPPSPNPGPRNPGEARTMGMTAAKIVPGAHVQIKDPWHNRYPFLGAIVQADLRVDLVGFNGCEVEGGVSFMGMSVRALGVLRAPIESIDEVNPGTLTGLAGDGGTFTVGVHAHYL